MVYQDWKFDEKSEIEREKLSKKMNDYKWNEYLKLTFEVIYSWHHDSLWMFVEMCLDMSSRMIEILAEDRKITFARTFVCFVFILRLIPSQ